MTTAERPHISDEELSLPHAPAPSRPSKRDYGQDQRVTKLRRTRRAWDCIIAAHYHYSRDPKLGYRSIARMFNMPFTTVRHIVARTDRDDADVKQSALRFGLLKINLHNARQGPPGARDIALTELFADLAGDDGGDDGDDRYSRVDN